MSDHSNEPLASDQRSPSSWVNRWAVLLVCLTWPLIWVGGLVTTYDAGMAVPDWPNTYGSNMFLYPWTTWLFGPFDLFIEHGHRLLASLVGLITIFMLIAAVRSEKRRWVVRLCVFTLVGVIFQGILGGVRVVLDARLVAMIHGCFGPAFFVLCWCVAAVTSRWWAERQPAERLDLPLRYLGATALLSYIQLVLGAQLRHVPLGASAGFFKNVVVLHVLIANVLAVLIGYLAWKLRRCGDMTLARVAKGLLGLVLIQWSLGLGTWFVNYAWPFGLDRWPRLAGYVIQAKGWHESMIVTSHVAIGSLILALLWFAYLRASRSAGVTGFSNFVVNEERLQT